MQLTPHPEWLREGLAAARPVEARITSGRLFTEMAEGRLSLSRFRCALANFHRLVQLFPKYLQNAADLATNEYGELGRRARAWLLHNRRLERHHVGWYRDWATAFGVPREALDPSFVPLAAVDSVNHYLSCIAGEGPLETAMAAINYGIEGPTGVWARAVYAGIEVYAHRDGVRVGERSTRWLRAHAAYDDRHPVEALEYIKSLAGRSADRRRSVVIAIRRSMEYYAIAAEACYSMGEITPYGVVSGFT